MKVAFEQEEGNLPHTLYLGILGLNRTIVPVVVSENASICCSLI